MMNIFITGCAKTRTTLVQWLFSAFDSTVVIPGEWILYSFTGNGFVVRDDTNVVIKRIYEAPFSSKMNSEEEFQRQLQFIRETKTKVVYVTRDRDDVLASEGGYVPPDRFDYCENLVDQHPDLITFKLNSDHILADPNGTQKNLARSLGLKILHKWSAWPDFAPMRQIMAYNPYTKMFRPFGG